MAYCNFYNAFLYTGMSLLVISSTVSIVCSSKYSIKFFDERERVVESLLDAIPSLPPASLDNCFEFKVTLVASSDNISLIFYYLEDTFLLMLVLVSSPLTIVLFMATEKYRSIDLVISLYKLTCLSLVVN